MKKSVFYHHMAEAASQKGMAIQDIIRQVHSLGIGWAEVDLADLKRDNSIADILKMRAWEYHLSTDFMILAAHRMAPQALSTFSLQKSSAVKSNDNSGLLRLR